MMEGEVSATTLSLLTQLEFLRHRLVTTHVRGVQIIQEPPPFADHHEQSAPGAVIFAVFLQMVGQMVNSFGEQRNLDIG